jgi:hypothetical protein
MRESMKLSPQHSVLIPFVRGKDLILCPIKKKINEKDLHYYRNPCKMQSPLLARVCVLCVWFIEKLKGREKEKGIKTKMRVKLAAKLLIIAWTLMKKKEPFNPELLKIKK